MNNKLFGGIKIFKSKFFKDNRGSFREVYKKKFIKNKDFIFDCLSISKKNVLRGLHIQTKNSQAKFLTIIKGSRLAKHHFFLQKNKFFKRKNSKK